MWLLNKYSIPFTIKRDPTMTSEEHKIFNLLLERIELLETNIFTIMAMTKTSEYKIHPINRDLENTIINLLNTTKPKP